jgi:hypothetical protein
MNVISRFLLSFSLLVMVGCVKNIDENPIVKEGLLVGKYSNESLMIELSEDHQFIFDMKMNKYSGSWALQDSYLYLTSTSEEAFYFKIISEDGNYQLIHIKNVQQDPDEWDWSSTMKKEQVK